MFAAETTTGPMLGVGAFIVLFWVGFVVGDALGWSCAGLLILGLLLATIGAYGFARADGTRAAPESGE